MSDSRTRTIPLLLSLLFPLLAGFSSAPLSAQELPRPTLDNSLVVSIEHSPADSAEVDYIKANFPFGLYAWLSFSITTVPIDMSWTQALDPASASAGIAAFKAQVNAYVAAAKAKKVRLHLVLTSGLARNVSIYKPAKIEDIRNAQWYNDNKLASDAQIAAPDPSPRLRHGHALALCPQGPGQSLRQVQGRGRVPQAGHGRQPRHARCRQRLGRGRAQFQPDRSRREPPGILLRLSPRSPSSSSGIGSSTPAFMTTRQGTYRAQGFPGGGAKYQGAAGLTQFNADYGTSFTTWDLLFYNWSLADDYDQDPTDTANPDPHRIPFSSYNHGHMMPADPEHGLIVGGFDPPRV